MKTTFFILFLTLVVTSATAQKDTIMQQAEILHIQYADKNNNRYILTPDKIKYRPIQPHESSSGTYSGGEPKTMEWAIEEWEACKEIVNQIIQEERLHLKQRRMLTSVLLISFAEDVDKMRLILGKSELHNLLINQLRESLALD